MGDILGMGVVVGIVKVNILFLPGKICITNVPV